MMPADPNARGIVPAILSIGFAILGPLPRSILQNSQEIQFAAEQFALNIHDDRHHGFRPLAIARLALEDVVHSFNIPVMGMTQAAAARMAISVHLTLVGAGETRPEQSLA